MSKHLRFNLLYGMLDGEAYPGHPQEVMLELGIIYQHATPQTIGDQWWFWNCENVPTPLPPYLSILDVDPLEMIGFGLSEKDAIKIRDYNSE